MVSKISRSSFHPQPSGGAKDGAALSSRKSVPSHKKGDKGSEQGSKSGALPPTSQSPILKKEPPSEL